MSLPNPPTFGAAADHDGRRTVPLELDDARLQAALTVAGLEADKAGLAVQVLRAELGREPGLRATAPSDTTVQKDAGRFRTLADITPQLIWHSMDEGRWLWAAPSWLAFTGQSQKESQDQGWLAAVHPEDHDRTMEAWRLAQEYGSFDVEHRIRRALDGAWRMHQTRSAPLRGRPGERTASDLAREWVGASTDVEDFRRLETEQHALLLELQHRTRNLLAVVQVIAHRSLPPVVGRSDFTARLAALGRVQGFLARNATWSVPLRDLVEAELQALVDSGSTRAQVAGPQVDLPGELVQPIALALHELASNAAKHGAMSQPTGQLSVTWCLESADGVTRLVIEWCESGVAMPSEPLARRFGCQIIERTVPYQLRGEASLKSSADGIRCRLALPFPEEGGPQSNDWTESTRASRFSPNREART